ncbi:hypothetical protein [Thermodesulfovibrio hydrogeniphilus]
MQTIYKIETFEDLLKALKEREDWLEQLRALILTEELLSLPKKFDEFVKKDFKELKDKVGNLETRMDNLETRMDNLETRMDNLETRMDNLETRMDNLEKRVAKLEIDVAELKAENFERKVREKAPAYFGKLIRKCKVIGFEELAEILEKAVDEGKITEEEKDDVLNIDVVVTGFLKEDRQQKVAIAAEVSVKVDKEDVERASKRKIVLEKAMEIPVLSVSIGREFSKSVKALAEKLNVILVSCH